MVDRTLTPGTKPTVSSNGNDTLENAQRRSEYWKAEHLAANREIERLRAGLERVLGTLRMYSRETAAAYDDILASEAAHAPETFDGPTPHHVQYDTVGWLCSICGGWNREAFTSCTHAHAQKASEVRASPHILGNSPADDI